MPLHSVGVGKSGTSRWMRAFLPIVTLVYIASLLSVSGANQTALFNFLFDNYRNQVRPVCDVDLPVNVSIGLAIRQIIDLDEPKQILSLNAWVRLRWRDCQLVWDKDAYGGLSTLTVPFEKVWVPDITLYDNAEAEFSGLKDFRPTISSDGTVSYNFPTVLSVLCKMDVTFFPFDTQSCPLKFGSWAYHGLQVDVSNRSSSGDTSTFHPNSEWNTPTVPVVRNVFYYTCCPEPYPDVTFFVTMKRKPLFYVLNLLFPCMLITAVAMLGFLLPPDAGEKVSLEITVLLSLAVFLLVVSETLPPTSENFPYIGIYFACAMLLVSFSTILTVVVLNYHFKGLHGQPVSPWIRRWVLGYMARFLRVRAVKDSTVHPNNLGKGTIIQVEPAHKMNNIQSNGHTNGVVFGIHNNDFNLDNETNEDLAEAQSSPSMLPVLHVLNEQLHVLRRMDDRYEKKEKMAVLNAEWFTVAMVMDRLFLAVFAIVSVIITLAILLQCV